MQTTQSSIRLARCQVGDRTFGLDMAAIIGIQPIQVVRWGSGPDSQQVDQIMTQGRSIAVYSLARLLELPEEANPRGHCLVVSDGQEVWGLLADRVSQHHSQTGSTYTV